MNQVSMAPLNTAATKPAIIQPAISLLWASLAIAAVKVALDWTNFVGRGSAAMTVCIMIFTFAVIGFFVVKIGQGKNWARVVFLVLFVLGIVVAILTWRSEFAHSRLLGILSIVQAALQATALYFIFTSPGKEWYRKVQS